LDEAEARADRSRAAARRIGARSARVGVFSAGRRFLEECCKSITVVVWLPEKAAVRSINEPEEEIEAVPGGAAGASRSGPSPEICCRAGSR